METKELKIDIPEGYEIDEENSTFTNIKFKPIKRQDEYYDIALELFGPDKKFYTMENSGLGFVYIAQSFKYSLYRSSSTNELNCTSRKQAEKLLAINKILNVAKYFNGDEEFDWNDNNYKYYPYIDVFNKLSITQCINNNNSFVYFHREVDLRKAIEILGEDTFRLALSTDW